MEALGAVDEKRIRKSVKFQGNVYFEGPLCPCGMCNLSKFSGKVQVDLIGKNLEEVEKCAVKVSSVCPCLNNHSFIIARRGLKTRCIPVESEVMDNRRVEGILRGRN